MNDQERLKLQEMIKANNVEDQTDKIRCLKHSEAIRKDVDTIQKLKCTAKKDAFKNECSNKCNFLFNNYTDIFNKLIANEIDIKLLYNFIDMLEKIENGEKDQHEASFEVGKILRKIYVDSAVKRGVNLETSDKPPEKRECRKLSWRDYKIMNEKFKDHDN